MSYDYEHTELENKIRDLQREIDNIKYDIQRLQEDKAEKDHSHKIREAY